MSEYILVKDEGAVRVVRMNRPEKKNALTSSMYEAMTAAVTDAGASSPIRCVLLTGVPGAFCAGNDLQDFLSVAKGATHNPAAQTFLHALARSERPLVAAVQGVAVGIGTTMCLHCDYVIAADDARFSTPFVSLGLVPEAASSLLGPRLIGYQRAFALLAMGLPLGAAAAHSCGLVNSIATPETIDAEGMKAARHIAALPPEAVAMTRRLLRGSPEEIVSRIDEETRAFRERLKSTEARAALEAFTTRKR